jgi:two-component system NtrC family sensor kinase
MILGMNNQRLVNSSQSQPEVIANKAKGVDILGTFLESTQSKEAEAERQKLVAILHKTPLAVIEWDTQFRVKEWNLSAQRIFGYTREEALGCSFEFIVPESARKHVDRVTAQLLTQQGGSESVNENITKDGRTIICEWYNTPILDGDGKVMSVCSMALDITQRKQAEAAVQESEAQLRKQKQELEQALFELQHSQIQLVQSEKMSSLGQLVAGVAHEINNPVSFIYGNITHAQEYIQDLLKLLQLYKEKYTYPVPQIQQFEDAIDVRFLTQDLPKLLNSMKVGATRIRQIVASLRTFSRMDEAEMKEVDIHENIDSTLMILEHRLKANSHHPEITVIKEYGNLPLVQCYAGQLNQVFMNILANAVDALEETFKEVNQNPKSKIQNPQIRIYTQLSESNQVTISIADNGPGISEEVKQHLFDPFFTTKPIGKGTGMGLSISYQIITDRHGGSLECLSQLGSGAQFLITIPLQQRSWN